MSLNTNSAAVAAAAAAGVSSPTTAAPPRSSTLSSSSSTKEDALAGELPDSTYVLLARLENWRHAVKILEDYVDGQLSLYKTLGSSYEKQRKAVADAPKFDFASGPSGPARVSSPVGSPNLGRSSTIKSFSSAGSAPGAPGTVSGGEPVGIAESFAELRTRTEALLNRANQVEAELKQSVVPHLETLRGDIEKHYKGLKGPGLKGQKEVEKAKQTTQKAIESLGQYVASAGTVSTAKISPQNDPYVLHRQVLNSVNDQIIKENSQADQMVSTQRNFQTLEQHIIQVLQEATRTIDQIVQPFAALLSESYGSVANTFGEVSSEREWSQFATTNAETLVNEGHNRDINSISFTNDSAPSTVPVIQGILERKGTVVKSYSSAFFVLTPANYLHQFKSQDHILDPLPELSLYLPECSLGAPATQESGKYKFKLQGKPVSKTISTKHTYTFKAPTYQEMTAWYEALTAANKGSALTSPAIGEQAISEDENSDDESPVATEPAVNVHTERVVQSTVVQTEQPATESTDALSTTAVKSETFESSTATPVQVPEQVSEQVSGQIPEQSQTERLVSETSNLNL